MQRSNSRGIYATLKAISSLQLVGFLTTRLDAWLKDNLAQIPQRK